MKEDGLVRHVAGKGEVRNAHNTLIWTPEGLYRVGGLGRSWQIIKFYVNEIMCEGVDWTKLTQN